ncbi:hypothetical protein [uncultured Clostridium sp.]|uniref:hypothetical protein n=1 Tax=uncultured Clostridium sp. TaxID=59620 RepID=UPI0026078E54|nr:hypothetical protein [uncultured Clostridium sp.]
MLGCDMNGICDFRSQCGSIECPYITSQREEAEQWCFDEGLNGNCNYECERYGTEFCALEEE